MPAYLQIVLGFIESVLWASLATLVAGCLVYVRSSHDEARKAAAFLVRDSGARISRWGLFGGSALTTAILRPTARSCLSFFVSMR